jgi:hypothetical protein
VAEEGPFDPQGGSQGHRAEPQYQPRRVREGSEGRRIMPDEVSAEIVESVKDQRPEPPAFPEMWCVTCWTWIADRKSGRWVAIGMAFDSREKADRQAVDCAKDGDRCIRIARIPGEVQP